MSIYDVVVLMMKVGMGPRLTIRNLHKQNKTKMGGGREDSHFFFKNPNPCVGGGGGVVYL